MPGCESRRVPRGTTEAVAWSTRMTTVSPRITVTCMNRIDSRDLAAQHAAEAERLLAGRLGLINNVIKAGVHATLAVYYAAESRRTAVEADAPPTP
jgi:hypothetical protein